MFRFPLFLWWAGTCASAVELYSTGFENFTPGPDRIAGVPASGTNPVIPATDGWTGSHAGQDRTGIFSEAEHAIPGIGHAAYFGGNTAPIFTGGPGIFVRKILNYDPLAQGTEVVTYRLRMGVQDSSGFNRDNFEFLLYTNNALGGGAAGSYPLGGIQFDNTQLNPASGKPWQEIYRYSYDTAPASMRYTSTGVTFLYGTLHDLEIRVNFRTNKWSAALDTVPLFSDLPFYNGPYARNVGSVLIQSKVSSALLPGNNYLLVDDLTITAEPLPAPGLPDLIWSRDEGVQLKWEQEAGYRYEVRSAADLGFWTKVSGGEAKTATTTAFSGSFTDASSVGIPRRFYKIIRSWP